MLVHYIYIHVFQDLTDNTNSEIDGARVGGASGVSDSGASATQSSQSMSQADTTETTGQKRKLPGWMDGKTKPVMSKKMRSNSLFR